MWSWFFYWRKDQGQVDLPDTLNDFIKSTENFLEAFEKSFNSKYEVLSEYSSLTSSFIFQNLNFFHFSWRIIWLVCRTVTSFLLTQRAKLSGPSRYLKRVHKVYRKFSRGIWKKFSTQNMRFYQNIPAWLRASFFKISTFFHFSWRIIWLVCRTVTIFYWRKERS